MFAGAIIGALAGAGTGMLLNISCANEHSSGCADIPIAFGTLGGGIGAGIAAIAAR